MFLKNNHLNSQSTRFNKNCKSITGKLSKEVQKIVETATDLFESISPKRGIDRLTKRSCRLAGDDL